MRNITQAATPSVMQPTSQSMKQAPTNQHGYDEHIQEQPHTQNCGSDLACNTVTEFNATHIPPSPSLNGLNGHRDAHGAPSKVPQSDFVPAPTTVELLTPNLRGWAQSEGFLGDLESEVTAFLRFHASEGTRLSAGGWTAELLSHLRGVIEGHTTAFTQPNYEAIQCEGIGDETDETDGGEALHLHDDLPF